MSARALFALEAVAGCAACLLFWASPFCCASMVMLGVCVACAFGVIVAD